MKIANGIEVLEISSNIMGKVNTINPTLLYDDNAVILVDAGYPGLLSEFKETIEKAGVSFGRLNMIILTHHDIDHIGSVNSIKKELSNSVTVLAHEQEAAYVDGSKTPIKLAQLEANFDSLPKAMKELYEKFKVGFQNSKADVDKILVDNEELPYCNGISVIHTPGHTLGHISLYLKQSKILIAGDALEVRDGKLMLISPQFSFDSELSIKSLKKLMQYDIETVICYHGGVYNNKVNERIKELANA